MAHRPTLPEHIYQRARALLPRIDPRAHWRPCFGTDGTWRFWAWLPRLTASGVLVYYRGGQAVFDEQGRFLGS